MTQQERLQKKLDEERARLAAIEAAPATEPATAGDAAAPAASETPAPENPPAQTPAPEQKIDYFQQWSTQNGLLKEQRERIKALEDELARKAKSDAEMLAKIDAMIAAPPAQTPPAAPEAPPAKQTFAVTTETLTEEEDSVLGGQDAELASAIRKIALQVFAQSGVPAIESRIGSVEARIAEVEKALREELTGVRTQVDAVTRKEAQTAAEKFEAALSELMPNYAGIYNSPDFIEWAKVTRDRRTKIAYAEIITYHVENADDPNVVADIMKEYVEARGLASAPVETPPAVQQTPPAAPVVSEIPAGLEEQIAPARSSGVGDPAATKPKQTITIDEVKRLGMIAAQKKTQEAAQAYEAAKKLFESLNTALAQGR